MNWIIVSILILLAALLLDLGLLAYVLYVLLAVLLISRFLTRKWAEQLQASRSCNRLSAYIGEKIAVAVTLKNDGAWPVPWVLVEDLLPREALVREPPALKLHGRRLLLAMLGANQQRTLLYQLTCNRRGYYQIGPLIMETGDLFGLHRRFRISTKPHFLLVYPRVVPLEGYEISSRRPLGEIRISYQLFEDPTRIAGVRQYQPGDPINRLHWRATARTGVLHSKVYEPTSTAGATLLLDFHQASYDADQEPFRSELAVTAAASIANAVYEMGQQVGLVTNGRDAADRIRQEGWAVDLRRRDVARKQASMKEASDRLQPQIVPTRVGVETFMRIQETLARVELTDGLTLPELIVESASRIARDASVIAILTAVTPTIAIALGNLRRQGHAVTALVNVYDEGDFARISGPLLSEGIGVSHLRDDPELINICRDLILA